MYLRLDSVLFSKKEHRAIEAAVEKAFTGGEVTLEATLVTKSGKKIPRVYSAVRTMLGDKPVLMGFGINISERKKTEQQLQKALSEMKVLKNRLEEECTYLGEEIKLIHDYGNIIGESEVMKYVLYSGMSPGKVVPLTFLESIPARFAGGCANTEFADPQPVSNLSSAVCDCHI